MRTKMLGEEGHGKGYGAHLAFCERHFDEFYYRDFPFSVKISP